jgi:hypothetical protein
MGIGHLSAQAFSGARALRRLSTGKKASPQSIVHPPFLLAQRAIRARVARLLEGTMKRLILTAILLTGLLFAAQPALAGGSGLRSYGRVSLTSPQQVSLAFGVTAGGMFDYGYFAELEPGIGGVKASVGIGQVPAGALNAWDETSWSVKGSVLYTFGASMDVEPENLYVGAEIAGGTSVGLHLGVYARILGDDQGEDVIFSWALSKALW